MVNGFLMVELGNSKDTTKTDCSDLLNGLTGVHKVLCSAAEIACNGRQYFCVGHDGGYMIPIRNKIGQGMSIHFETIVELAWKERTHCSPSREQHFQVQLESSSDINRDQQCEQSSAVRKR